VKVTSSYFIQEKKLRFVMSSAHISERFDRKVPWCIQLCF